MNAYLSTHINMSHVHACMYICIRIHIPHTKMSIPDPAWTGRLTWLPHSGCTHKYLYILICHKYMHVCMHTNTHPHTKMSIPDPAWTGRLTWLPPSGVVGTTTCLRYVCMYVCTYACMHACMYVCMYVYMYVCVRVCVYLCMYVCMYVCIYV